MADFAEERSKQAVPPIDLEVHRVPFFLEPGYMDQPDGWWEPHNTRMVRKFGSQAAFDRVKVAHRLMPRAAEAGLDAEGWSDANLDRRKQSSTLRAHRLIAWLDDTLGWEKAEVAYARLHQSHFVEGGLLNDVAELSAAAAAAGADPLATATFLASDAGADVVIERAETVHALGIHSIPALFVDGRHARARAPGRA